MAVIKQACGPHSIDATLLADEVASVTIAREDTVYSHCYRVSFEMLPEYLLSSA